MINLTEKWKAGELERGLYWVIYQGENVIAECVAFGNVSNSFEIKTKNDFMVRVSEVLAPCSYEYLQAKEQRIEALQHAFNKIKPCLDKSKEEISAYIHNMWSNWYKHQRDNSNFENIKRWNKQAETPYFSLSEDDKKKDREFAQYIINVIKSLLMED